MMTRLGSLYYRYQLLYHCYVPYLTSLLYRRWDGLLFLAVLTLCWPVFFERGIIINGDYPHWASVIKMFDTELFPDYRWFWSIPFLRVNAGEILGQPYSLSIILPWLLFQILPFSLVIKILIVSSLLVLAFGLYYFARQYSCPFTAALVAYLCTLLNLRIISIGTWYNSLSIGLTFWFWISLRKFTTSARLRYWIGALVVLFVTILAHPLGTVMAFVGWFGCFLCLLIHASTYSRSTVLLVLLLPILACTLAYPQIDANLTANTCPPENYQVAWRFPIFEPFGLRLRVFILLGAVFGIYFLFRHQKDIAYIVVPSLIVAGAIYWNMIAFVPFDFPAKNGLIAFAWKFKLLLSALALVLFALGVSRLSGMAQTASSRKTSIVQCAAIILLLMTTFDGLSIGIRQTLVTQTRSMVGEDQVFQHDFVSLCKWINRNIAYDSERIYIENTYDNNQFPVYPTSSFGCFLADILTIKPKHTSHYLSLINLFTPAHLINAYPTYRNAFCNHYSRLFKMELDKLTPEIVLDRMQVLNCRHIVTVTPDVFRFLRSLPFLSNSAQFGIFNVFTYKEMQPHLAWSDYYNPIPAKKVSNVEYHFDLSKVETNRIYISLQYHPNWKAKIADREIIIYESDALMRLTVPADKRGTLVLYYENNRLLSLLIVFMGLCGTIILIVLCYKGSQCNGT